MKLYLAADHGGFALKQKVKEYFVKQDVLCDDVGAFSYVADDDYTDVAHALATKMAGDDQALGVAFCRSGGGMCIALNKHKGIRAAQGFNVRETEKLRNDDDIRILCIGAEYITEQNAYAFVDAFMHTPFSGEERYVRRIKEIGDIEQGTFQSS